MGRASTRKNVNRAARAAGRGPRRRSFAWPLTIAAIAVLGTVLVVVSTGDAARDETPPRIGDHWHAAYAVYDCETPLAPFGDTMSVSGLHTHSDGLIHVEPRSTNETGANATLANFLKAAGAEITDDGLKLSGGRSLAAGQECGGKPAELTARVWDDGTTTGPGRVVPSAELAGLRLTDGLVVSVGVTADGASLPPPTSVSGLAEQRGQPGQP